MIKNRSAHSTILTDLDFEPLQEVAEQSPGATELLEYEECSRRELPRMFQDALESAINQEAEPIADRLRTQLINMIQECQALISQNIDLK